MRVLLEIYIGHLKNFLNALLPGGTDPLMAIIRGYRVCRSDEKQHLSRKPAARFNFRNQIKSTSSGWLVRLICTNIGLPKSARFTAPKFTCATYMKFNRSQFVVFQAPVKHFAKCCPKLQPWDIRGGETLFRRPKTIGIRKVFLEGSQEPSVSVLVFDPCRNPPNWGAAV